MHGLRTLTLLSVTFLGLVTGCAAPAVTAEPAAALVRVEDYGAFFDGTLSVLRQLDLEPARADRERGIIESQPTVSAQWFELWRGDAPGGYNLLESSLHTTRRTATIRMQPRPGGPPVRTLDSDEDAPAPGELDLSVEVTKERFHSPSRQVTTASGALSLYSERLPTERGIRAGRLGGDHWSPRGRDSVLEADLLRRLRELPGVTVLTQPASSQSGMPTSTAGPVSPSPARPAAPPPPGDWIPMEPLPRGR